MGIWKLNWLEKKYIDIAGLKLRNFKKKLGNLYNFSCIFCGDSSSNKTKARAYIFEKDNKPFFYCHNCSKSSSFDKFLEKLDGSLFSDFKMERFRESSDGNREIIVPKSPTFSINNSTIFKGLKTVSQLSHEHYCKKYVDERRIPTFFHRKLYFANKFMKFVNTLIPGKFEASAVEAYDEPRLIIPFYNEKSECFSFTGRSFKPDTKPKYIQIFLDNSYPKIYGLERVNFNKRTYVVEGPVDSMFIPNTIATAGATLYSELSSYKKDNFVLISDNQPRNKQIVQAIDKAIHSGYKVCIWEDGMSYKDINEMIIDGYKPDDIKSIIDANIYSGISAELRLAEWRKS